MDNLPDHLRSPWPEWTLAELLGEGAFSTVWHAVCEASNGEAAIKALRIVPNEEDSESRIIMKSYEQAAAYADELDRLMLIQDAEHIVRIDEYRMVSYPDSHETFIWIRMERLKSLTAYMADKEMTEGEVLRLGLDICDALAVIHGQDILHCDIKPDNILVDERQPSNPVFKLGDLGISRKHLQSSPFFAPCGSPAYMAPELTEGKSPDPRSDLYSLGLTLYRLMNGNRLPFWPEHQLVSCQDREIALHMRLSAMPLPAPSQASLDFSAVLLRACAYEPSERFQNAGEFRAALQRLLKKQIRKEHCARMIHAIRKPSYLVPIVVIIILFAALLIWKPGQSRTPSDPTPETMVSAIRISLYDSLKEQLDALYSVVASNDQYVVPVHLDRLPVIPNLSRLPLSPAWMGEALILNDASKEWNVFLSYQGGQVVSYIPCENEPDESSVSGIAYHPAAPSENDNPLSLTIALGNPLTSRCVLELNYDPFNLSLVSSSLTFFGPNRTVLTDIVMDPAVPDRTWHLQQHPDRLPLDALYRDDMQLKQITFHHQTWDVSGSLPIIEGVEYLP